jgi:hypothetical protein
MFAEAGRVVALAGLVLSWGLTTEAQTRDSATVIPALYSSDTMTRNADLSLAGAVVATAALDRAIAAAWSGRPDSVASRTTRLAKLAAFDVPVVLFAVGLNHEGGHIARAREQAFDYTFAVVGSPWSSRPFELIGISPAIFDDLGSQAGGFEASRRLKDRSEALLWHTGRVAPGHALAAIIASLDLPVYAWYSLAPGNLAEPGDPARVLSIVVRDRDAWLEFDDYRSRMRRRASWNLIDSALWTLAYGLARDHLWRGDRGVPVRWLRIGGVDLLPGVRYEWTSIGPEYAVRSHYRAGGVAGLGYFRWTERFGNARQFGAGGSASWDIDASLRSRVDLDLWSHTRDDGGAHGAVSVEIDRWAPGASSLIVSVGAKSRGHVSSLPPDAGAYVTAGMLVRVW